MANVTRKRTGGFLRTLFKILMAEPAGMKAGLLLDQVAKTSNLTAWEKGDYPSGGQRFQKIVRFASVDCVKAGWLQKEQGVWLVTEAGQKAFAQFPDPEQFYKEACRLYAEWKQERDAVAGSPSAQITDQEIEAGAEKLSFTFEEAEEQARDQIEKFLHTSDPFEFQAIVADLLSGMGYHVSWMSPRSLYVPEAFSMQSAGFEREAIDVNLRRIPWLLVASMVLALWPLASFWHASEMAWLRITLFFDLASAGLFLALNVPVRRLPRSSLWRDVYVWTAVVLALGYMDGYYFLVTHSFGQNPAYILGVIMTATLFLLPPPRFLPLLVANHLIYSALLAGQSGIGTEFGAVLIQNTTGAVVAGLVSLLLYRARREEYRQRQALAVANRFLLRRNEQLNDLMAITAHDLRGPLLGYATW